MKKKNLIPDEVIIDKIYFLRNQKVMIDADLAELYGVETKVLKQSVRRNIIRFPEDFMFEMNKKEVEIWRGEHKEKLAIRMGLRHAPFCFTEQGVIMLSCVLKSERAIGVNIRIIRILIRLREIIVSNKDILLRIEQLEKRMLGNEHKASKQEDEIQVIFKALKQLLNPPIEPRQKIGFEIKNG